MKLNILKTFILLGLTGFLLSFANAQAVPGFFADNTTNTILEEIGMDLLTPPEVFQYIKNWYIGYPYKILFDYIDFICTYANYIDAVQYMLIPQVNNLTLRMFTKCQNYSFPILKSDEIYRSPHFDRSKPVVILIAGWTNTIDNSNMIYEISKAYLCRGGVNVIGLDASNYTTTFYALSALNARDIGKYLAQSIVKLEKIVPLENIHLIGHSLGANIAGYTGKFFQNMTGRLLPRITGLDPAKPCFHMGQKLMPIEKGDAEFVDVIHTNPGVLGIEKEIGDVDYYPDGLLPLKSGCLTISCSHNRAHEYYAESVYPGHENDFLAVKCHSIFELRIGLCNTTERYIMGYAVQKDIKGIFYSKVTAQFPYGSESEKIPPYIKECGTCDRPEDKKDTIKFE
ncbi:phospholipase A1 2-like [Condylostylus longicornis]|uniref:phospholipase A1 2-like n=1 Tax=Condylostylus longicornis TaxID=2530218 RepID=UPI00244E35DA|nr:phospholipase A1 2-like [Condylostylus longicornis]